MALPAKKKRIFLCRSVPVPSHPIPHHLATRIPCTKLHHLDEKASYDYRHVPKCPTAGDT